jgi:pyruvate/oxaloacetate carboxyltransferase
MEEIMNKKTIEKGNELIKKIKETREKILYLENVGRTSPIIVTISGKDILYGDDYQNIHPTLIEILTKMHSKYVDKLEQLKD